MKEQKSKKYIAPDGTEYASYEEYCNSPDLDLDLVQLKLFRGLRTPQNDFERGLLNDINEAKKKKTFLDIYPE